MIEVWKDVEGYEGIYQVSNMGRVKSLKRNVLKSDGKIQPIPERILKGKRDKDGYIEVKLTNFNFIKYIRVHRLVLITFLGYDSHKSQVNHKNGVKDDNRLENLEWCTQVENTLHSLYKLGNYDNLNMDGLNKPFKVNKLDLNGNVIQTYNSMREVEQVEGISRNTINKYNTLKEPYKGYIWDVVRC